MWKAIPDMSDAELVEARREVADRLRSVAGHNKAMRLEERRDAIDAEIGERAAVDKPGLVVTVAKELPSGDYVEVKAERRDNSGTLSPGYSATFTLWEARSNMKGITRKERGLDCDSFGADSVRIVRAAPELGPLVALHLSDLDGTPMHAEANGFYFYSGAHEAYELEHYGTDYVKRHGTGKERAARILRCEVADLPEDVDAEAFGVWIAAQRPRWAREAVEADAVLVRLVEEQSLMTADDLGRFVLEIEPGNEAMTRGMHVAVALRDVAAKLDPVTDWEGEGIVRDGNGNTVGRWTFHDHN